MGSFFGIYNVKTAGTYSHTSSLSEQTVITFTTPNTNRKISITFDLTNLAQTTTIKVYEKIDGTNYRLYDSKAFPTDFATSQIAVSIELTGKGKDFKITFTSGIVEGSTKSVPYAYSVSDL